MASPASHAVTSSQFAFLLASYPALIASISTAREKPGQRTLQVLDDFRYLDAPRDFGVDPQKRHMCLDDVKLLVEWKLRHGKFRPALMKLVSSNDNADTKNAIEKAVTLYRQQSDQLVEVIEQQALALLTGALRGIGPATASLLLAVHQPDHAIFFSDEAFYWLCGGGVKVQIKYTLAEYKALSAAARAVMARLHVPASSIEKVAYVIMKQGAEQPKDSRIDSAKKRPQTKRKATEDATGPRRSSRRRLSPLAPP